MVTVYSSFPSPSKDADNKSCLAVVNFLKSTFNLLQSESSL